MKGHVYYGLPMVECGAGCPNFQHKEDELLSFCNLYKDRCVEEGDTCIRRTDDHKDEGE